MFGNPLHNVNIALYGILISVVLLGLVVAFITKLGKSTRKGMIRTGDAARSAQKVPEGDPIAPGLVRNEDERARVARDLDPTPRSGRADEKPFGHEPDFSQGESFRVRR
jgi:hypothetical protein